MKKLVITIMCLSIGTVLSSVESRAEITNLRISGDVKGQYVSQSDMDLETGDENGTDSQSVQGKIRASGDLTPDWSFFTEGMGVLNYGEGGGEDPVTGDSLGRDDYLELRELWLEKGNLFGQQPLSFQFGRQRFREDYGNWWNRNFDALRLHYDTTLVKSFIAVGENFTGYRTSGDDYNQDDEKIFRVLGETSWQWKLEHFVDFRMAYENDHSGLEGVGSQIDVLDRDQDDGSLLWTGVRMAGRLSGDEDTLRKSKYRFDLMGVVGEEDALTTVAGPPGFLTVTGNTNNDVIGWAFDAGVDIVLPVSFEPVLMLGYAFGSGDDDATDGTNHAFRQNGLYSNYGYPGLSTSGSNSYGSVLRPELSNLHILTAGIGLPIFRVSDLSFIYHYYRLVDEDGDMRTNGIGAALSNDSADVGHGADIILNVNLSEELGLKLPQAIKGVDFRTTMGAFQSGDAYGAASDELAMRGLAEFRIRF